MNSPGMWVSVLVIAAITFGFRLSFIALHDRLRLPAKVTRALRFVPIAALTAIIVPALVMPAGALDIGLGNARLVAGLVAIAVAWRTRNTLATIGAGMLVLWGLTIL